MSMIRTVISHRITLYLCEGEDLVNPLGVLKSKIIVMFMQGIVAGTDGQIEVVNQMIVHILRMYNSKHPHTWDESLPHV